MKEFEVDYDEQDDGVQLYLYEDGKHVGCAMFCPVEEESLVRAFYVGQAWGYCRAVRH